MMFNFINDSWLGHYFMFCQTEMNIKNNWLNNYWSFVAFYNAWYQSVTIRYTLFYVTFIWGVSISVVSYLICSICQSIHEFIMCPKVSSDWLRSRKLYISNSRCNICITADYSMPWTNLCFENTPVSIQHKSIVGRHRPIRVAHGPITARCRFIKNASWEGIPR